MQRRSKQRNALDRVLDTADGFLTAAQLHRCLIERGERVSLSTVYRQLHAMTDDGTIEALPTVEGEARYRRCSLPSRHMHLICPKCGTAKDLIDEDLQDRVLHAASTQGFTMARQTIEITSPCATCP